jgi:hypothetical protein
MLTRKQIADRQGRKRRDKGANVRSHVELNGRSWRVVIDRYTPSWKFISRTVVSGLSFNEAQELRDNQ